MSNVGGSDEAMGACVRACDRKRRRRQEAEAYVCIMPQILHRVIPRVLGHSQARLQLIARFCEAHELGCEDESRVLGDDIAEPTRASRRSCA